MFINENWKLHTALLVTSCVYLHCEFQVTLMNSWEISGSCRCGFLLNRQFHYKSICIKLTSQPASAWDFKCSCLLRRTRKAANKTNQIKTEWNMRLCSLCFPGFSLPLNTRQNEPLSLSVLSYCQRGIWYSCCAWQFGAQVLVATGHVLCNPPQMKSSPLRQPTAHYAIH